MKSSNYKIFSCGNNITIKEGSPALSFLGGINKVIYRVDNNIIEVVEVEALKEINLTIDNKSKKIILIKSITNENIEEVKRLISRERFTVFAGENISEENIKGIIYLNSIKGEKEIDLKNLIRIINQEDMYVSIMAGGCSRYIVCGEAEYEKAIGNITLDLLNNLNFLKNSDEYIVKIFTKFEFDLRDI
ncbi:MAG: hypothetical protein ACRC2K_04080, partial [Clostridium sp.]